MLHEDAKAELVGELNQGLPHMFTMMNAARVAVGVQGVGVAEGAYQHALAYARERRQGRSAWSSEASAPIFDHPDVRRTLMLMKAKIEAARAICLCAGVAADLGRLATDVDERRRSALRAELLTPIAKAWSTDVGVEVASLGLQVHGGMGFIEETGAAQYYRDARIAPIYEGTNGIQALDLAGRKLNMESGEPVKDLLGEMSALVPQLDDALGAGLAAGVEATRQASAWLAERKGSADALAGATPYLKLFGDVLGGFMLAKGAVKAASGPAAARRAALARFYGEQVLSQAPGQLAGITAGAGDLEAADAML
jgi:hypothetical protein